ncbi:MAG: DNA helicase RecQ, partial [Armatimonadetes bacterium]|nr:DNA helicase RecQ [Armatimonadota bacterium]
LKRVFGYDEFRPLQESVIGALLSGRDALAVMPTGSGKSLCYQLPALVLPGPTVVVSPLISLMQDQVDQLAQAGVPAVFLNSTLSLEQYGENCRMLRQGRARMVYMAPETLLRPETLVLMEECRIPLFAIDEAHCISEWGHDFRPEYRQLRPVRNRLAGARCLALTATATPRVQEDIQKLLGIPASQSFVAGFDRPNLLLRAQTRLKDGGEQLLQFVKTHPDEAGILYCGTRELVDTLTHYLQEAGFRALPYHAGLPDPVRRENQRQFIRDECQIVVATVAFGMGINKPDVRWILHFNLPDCLETYYQQVGRAGRDGLPSECLLLHARGDGSTHFHFIEQGAEQERSGRLVRLQAMQRYANAARCRRAVLLSYFGDPEPAEPCGICDNCRAAGRPMRDVTDEARLFLRAVQESRQRFGLVQILRILRGSKAQEVVRRQLDQLPVHGAGKEQSEEFWRTVAQALLEEGLLEQDQEYGVLKVTARSRELESGRRVQVPETEPEVAATVQPKQAPADPALFETLRKLRREIAAEHGVAPYMVLSDRSLLDLCARRPRTRAALLQVHGIGEHKATVFGEPFLAAIRDFGGEPEEAPEATPAVETGAPRPAQRAAVRRRDA